MEKFKEYYDEGQEDELMNKYHDLTTHLLDLLTDNLEILSDEIADTVFELYEVADELSNDENDYEEMTTASAVGDYKPKLKMHEEDELEEGPKKKKRDKVARLKSRRLYKRNKSKLKSAGKRLRKTAKFKKYKVKAKRLGKRGKTASGKRTTKFF